MLHTDLHLFARVAIGAGVGFVLGFERQLRGSPAGDRTYALVCAAATAVTAVAGKSSPQAVAGILTGIGFIGAGLLVSSGNMVRGLTSAAAVFAVAGIGIVIGYDHTYLGLFLGALMLLVLELQHLPGIRFVDARNYADRFKNDKDPPLGEPAPRWPWSNDRPESPSN